MAIFIIIFAILPIIGLVMPIFRKAFGRRGMDQAPSAFEFQPDDNLDDIHRDDDKNRSDKSEKPSKEA